MNTEKFLANLVHQARAELLSSGQFYALCQEVRRQNSLAKLYFGEPSPSYLPGKITLPELRQFLDELAVYVKNKPQLQTEQYFCLKRSKIVVEIVGAGNIGRVAKIKINDGLNMAFKAYFDPEFVWQHGVWSEVPLGIWLTGKGVTKDIPKFLFAGESWAVWEWIDKETQPAERRGLSYEAIAKQFGLTPLNPLNHYNYNPHNIRLDLGGIQKEYRGRRFYDLILSVRFYLRKVRREGIMTLMVYLKPENIIYSWERFWSLIFPVVRMRIEGKMDS